MTTTKEREEALDQAKLDVHFCKNQCAHRDGGCVSINHKISRALIAEHERAEKAEAGWKHENAFVIDLRNKAAAALCERDRLRAEARGVEEK